MKKNYRNRAEYFRTFSETDKYETQIDKRKFPFIPVGASFYWDIIKIVFYANRMAKDGLYDDYRWVNSSFDVLDALEENGIKVYAEGIDYVRQLNSPAVFIANHMSTLETFILPSIINPIRRVIYIIKKELADFPLFGPVAVARDPIVVGRKNPREDLLHVLNEGKRRLAEGRSIIVFAQKTRSKEIDFSTFTTLGIKLAKQSKVPVIPIALVTDAWGNGKKLKDFGKIDPSKKVHFAFGKPIDIASGKDEMKTVIDFINSKIIEWGREDIIIG